MAAPLRRAATHKDPPCCISLPAAIPFCRPASRRSSAPSAGLRDSAAPGTIAAELARRNRDLQEFAAVASHDLQEPLRKIAAFGDRLASDYGPSLGDGGTDLVRRMQRAAERMRQLVESQPGEGSRFIVELPAVGWDRRL